MELYKITRTYTAKQLMESQMKKQQEYMIRLQEKDIFLEENVIIHIKECVNMKIICVIQKGIS